MAMWKRPEVVVVEDDPVLAQTLKRQLEFADMSAVILPFIRDVLDFFQHSCANVHLLLLDLNLPDGNGLWLFQRLQQRKQAVPTIFVTGEADERTKLRGLDMGGDDYLVKPFSLAELMSRVNAVLRRTVAVRYNQLQPGVSLGDSAFDFCGVRVQPAMMELCFGPERVRIGRRELGILSYMARNPHVMLSRPALVHGIWGRFANTRSRSLDQYVMKIRRIFAAHGRSTDWLKTVHGVGYCYKPEEPGASVVSGDGPPAAPPAPPAAAPGPGTGPEAAFLRKGPSPPLPATAPAPAVPRAEEEDFDFPESGPQDPASAPAAGAPLEDSSPGAQSIPGPPKDSSWSAVLEAEILRGARRPADPAAGHPRPPARF